MSSWNRWYQITLPANMFTGSKIISKLHRSVGTLKVCINVLTREKRISSDKASNLPKRDVRFILLK